MSHGSQLATFKKRVIDYITEKVKEGAFRNNPGDIKMSGERCVIVEATVGTTPLENCTVERLCNISDKIHFRPLQHLDREVLVVKKTDPVFKIRTDLKAGINKSRTKRMCVNYLTLPLRKMQLDECIIVYSDCPSSLVSSRKNTVKNGLQKALSEMGIEDMKFTVGATDKNDIGIWRIR